MNPQFDAPGAERVVERHVRRNNTNTVLGSTSLLTIPELGITLTTTSRNQFIRIRPSAVLITPSDSSRLSFLEWVIDGVSLATSVSNAYNSLSFTYNHHNSAQDVYVEPGVHVITVDTRSVGSAAAFWAGGGQSKVVYEIVERERDLVDVKREQWTVT